MTLTSMDFASQALEKNCSKFPINNAPPWSSLLEVQISRVYFDSINFEWNPEYEF